MGKIIGFGGRIASGKSVLASICQNYGYKKIYFAYNNFAFSHTLILFS